MAGSSRAVSVALESHSVATRRGLALLIVGAALLTLTLTGEATPVAALALAAAFAAALVLTGRWSTASGNATAAAARPAAGAQTRSDRLGPVLAGAAAPSGSTAIAATTAAATDRGLAILAAIPDAALIVDRAGLIVETNPVVVEVFPRGRPGLLVNQMCRSPEVVEAVQRALASGGVVVEIEEWVPVRRKLLMTARTLGPPDGSAAPTDPALLIVFRDVSEQEKLAQMRADFIANASHELRTPLATLSGFVDTLQGPARDDAEARDRFLSIMATQASRMTRLIDDLLSLSRVEMRAHVLPTGTVDLQDVASFVLQSMEPLAASFKAHISFHKLDTPVRVRGDRDELVQVLQNLVHNALKYGRPSDGHITIRLLRQARAPGERRRVTIEVEDDGPGIAAEHLPRLTERFYRVSPAVSRDRGGTGLGLAIVKNIVNRHRGEIGIRSAVGRGSTFSVTFEELPEKSTHSKN